MVKKQSYEMTLDEGWYSEQDMRDELGWSQRLVHYLAEPKSSFQCPCLHAHTLYARTEDKDQWRQTTLRVPESHPPEVSPARLNGLFDS